MFPCFTFHVNNFGSVNHTLQRRQSSRDLVNTFPQRPCIHPARATRPAIAQTPRGRHTSVNRFHELLRPNGYDYSHEIRQAGAQTSPLRHPTVLIRPRASHPRQLRDCIIKRRLLKDPPTARHWTGYFEWKRLPDVPPPSLYLRQRSSRFRLDPSASWAPFCLYAAIIFDPPYLLNGSSRRHHIRVTYSPGGLLSPPTTSPLHPQPLPVS